MDAAGITDAASDIADMLAEACVTDSLAATTDMEAEASAMVADVTAAVTTAAVTMAADTTAADTMAADTTAADSRAVEHLAAAAHAPLQEQMAAVVADSVAAVQAVPALQAPRLPHAATPVPHSALQ